MFVLIHGAYHAGWCWARVQDALEHEGESTLAPNLPGHGGEGWLSNQTIPAYVACIEDILKTTDEPVTLVGHSLGGTTALLAAARVPEKVARIIFLTAYIPIKGESTAGLVGKDPDSHAQVERFDIGDIRAISIRAASLGDAFYNDADAATLSKVQDRLQFQSPEPFKYEIDRMPPETIPKSAIICTQDRAISPPHQRWMAERIGCDPIVEMHTSHSPFMTAPDDLAKTLLSLSRA